MKVYLVYASLLPGGVAAFGSEDLAKAQADLLTGNVFVDQQAVEVLEEPIRVPTYTAFAHGRGISIELNQGERSGMGLDGVRGYGFSEEEAFNNYQSNKAAPKAIEDLAPLKYGTNVFGLK